MSLKTAGIFFFSSLCPSISYKNGKRQVYAVSSLYPFRKRFSVGQLFVHNRSYIFTDSSTAMVKGTPYLTSEVPLLSGEYSPRKPTVRSFPPSRWYRL